MYPLNTFTLFPPFPRENKVFIAMDFERFNQRWENVIKKGVEDVKHNGKPLEAYRVDIGKVSDSILTDIVYSISRFQLFLADITTIGKLPMGQNKEKAIRNSNVMYEVGMAHSVRLSEEVILFRSDEDELPFDIANIRVNKYDPDNNPEDAKKKIKDAIEEAFKEINLQKQFAVSRAAESLDFHSYLVLSAVASKEANEVLKLELLSDSTWSKIWKSILKPENKLLSNPLIVNSISRLLELEILRTRYENLLGEGKFVGPMSYEITPFGREVIKEIGDRIVNIREILKEKNKKASKLAE